MPTISEPIWKDRQERIAQVVKDFVEAKPRSVDDSPDVLSARLFGLGLRGNDLRTECNLAAMEKVQYRCKCAALGKSFIPHARNCPARY